MIVATDAAGVVSTFHLGPGPEGNRAADRCLHVEAYPAPAHGREVGLAQLLLLTIAEPRFAFLTFEYRLPRALVADARRIALRLLAAADADVDCRLAIGGVVGGEFEFFATQSCPVGATFTNSVQSVEAGLLPLADLGGEHLSTCLLFERRAAAIAFALTVEIA